MQRSAPDDETPISMLTGDRLMMWVFMWVVMRVIVPNP
jgi:hypothetical protein